jgi:hypothetical protein
VVVVVEKPRDTHKINEYKVNRERDIEKRKEMAFLISLCVCVCAFFKNHLSINIKKERIYVFF